jgi:predicted metal-dependent HD superfamily phosphohydrolase
MSNLKEIFTKTLSQSALDQYAISLLWNELDNQYSSANRHYHNMHHIQNFYSELLSVKNKLQDWECIIAALFYHDAIYKAHSKNNEEESALLAQRRLKNSNWDNTKVERCMAHILATKWHSYSDDMDSNYFTDADLSILGNSRSIYLKYCSDIRKEYSMFPNIIYNPGRRKVIKHFLDMDRIYKTDYFHQHFETQARINLLEELALYS